MRFFATASALLAMATAAIAQEQTADFNPVYSPETDENVVAGSTFEITWEAPEKYAAGTVSIHLIGGATQGTQIPIADIASGIPNADNKYSWAVDAALGDQAIYGLILRYESDPSIFQYSNPFHIVPEDDGEDSGEHEGEDGGVIVTTKTGIKTVTLSSCPPTSSTEVPIITTSSFALNTTSSTPIWTTSTTSTIQAINSTTSFVAPTQPPTTILPPPVVPTETPGVPAVPSEVPVGSAARFGSGAFAVIGGVVVALLL